jgi:hypothetical protein
MVFWIALYLTGAGPFVFSQDDEGKQRETDLRIMDEGRSVSGLC